MSIEHRMGGVIAILCAGLFCSACPVTLPASNQLKFRCSSDRDCLQGFHCHEQVCIDDSLDAAVLDTLAVVDSGQSLDGPNVDAHGDGSRPDLIAPDAFLNESSYQDRYRPDGSLPDVLLADASPDVHQTDTSLPDGFQNDGFQPDVFWLDVFQPDVFQPDVFQPDVLLPDTSQPDNSLPDTSLPDTSLPDTSLPDTFQPDTTLPDTFQPDTTLPDTFQPDTAQPDTYQPDWWNTQWPTRYRIGINNATWPSWSHFPALLVLDSANIDYADTQDTGRGLAFVDPDSGRRLPHEVERWDEGATSYVWLELDNVDSNTNGDYIWMYCRNDPMDLQTSYGEVWSNGYVGVWHMDANPMSALKSVKDSSPELKHGTPINMEPTDLVEAAIGRGLNFNDPDDIVGINNSWQTGGALDIVGGPMTLSAWVYVNAGGQGTIIGKRSGGYVQWQMQLERLSGGSDSNLSLLASQGDFLNAWYTERTLPVQTWYNLAVTINESGRPTAFYIDGESVSFLTWSDSGGDPLHFDINVSIGSRWGSGTPGSGTGFSLNAIIDEVRVSNEERSETWMAAQDAAMRGAFLTVLAAEYQ